MAHISKLIILTLCMVFSLPVFAKSQTTKANAKKIKQSKGNLVISRKEENIDQLLSDPPALPIDESSSTKGATKASKPIMSEPIQDWTLKTPAWFFAFNKSSFFISSEVGTQTMDYKSENTTSDTPPKKTKTTSETRTQFMHHRIGYAFENPFFVQLEFHQNFAETNTNNSTNNNEIVTTKKNFTGLSEPKLGIGGVWAHSLFTLGGKLSYTAETEALKARQTDNSKTSPSYLYNNSNGGSSLNIFQAGGGSSKNLSAFGSFDFSGILFNFGFDTTFFDEAKNEIDQNSGDTYKIKIKARSESQKFIGVEFEHLAKMGIHISQSVIDPIFASDSNTGGEKLKLNGIELISKFQLTSVFALRPSLYYGKFDLSNYNKGAGVDSAEVSFIRTKVGFDFSF